MIFNDQIIRELNGVTKEFIVKFFFLLFTYFMNTYICPQAGNQEPLCVFHVPVLVYTGEHLFFEND